VPPETLIRHDVRRAYGTVGTEAPPGGPLASHRRAGFFTSIADPVIDAAVGIRRHTAIEVTQSISRPPLIQSSTPESSIRSPRAGSTFSSAAELPE
jgi:hypothetical protein